MPTPSFIKADMPELALPPSSWDQVLFNLSLMILGKRVD